MSLKRTELEQAKAILDAWFAMEEPDADEAGNVARLAEFDGARGRESG